LGIFATLQFWETLAYLVKRTDQAKLELVIFLVKKTDWA
jgi:hypothetical protein